MLGNAVTIGMVATLTTGMTVDRSLRSITDDLNTFVRSGRGVLQPTSNLDANRHAWWAVFESGHKSMNLSDELEDVAIMPLIWGYRMCLKRDSCTWNIQSPKDLQGQVNIESPERAIEYLRCFSNVYATRLFARYHYIEVMDNSEKGWRFAHSDFSDLNEHTALCVRPGAREQDGAFVLTRYLLEYEAHCIPTTLHGVSERLTPCGHYEIVILNSHPYEEVSALIQLPMAPLPR
jgi:hypothetical protein